MLKLIFTTLILLIILNGKRIHFIFDGVDLDYVSQESERDRLNFIRGYLNYYTAQDIAGIEVMDNLKYGSSYYAGFSLTSGLTPGSFCYSEITTRSIHGPYMKVTPGTYLYKTLAFTLPKQFYSPKYTIKNKNTAIGTDLRSTIYWAPNIITDKEGKAFVSFYSADKAYTYTIIIEGTDMDGNLGYQRQKIKIYTSEPKPK